MARIWVKSKLNVPQDDGTYKISGTKIFISSGEHDLTDNIIHIVLARLPDAPEGTRGISLFIVPKFLVGDDGEADERNAVVCGSIEHKMGISSSATCVLNFDGATGYLIGEPNKGLKAMFTFMNTARIGTGIEGLAHTELASKTPYPTPKSVVLCGHCLARKTQIKWQMPSFIMPMCVELLTMKAFAEGGRSMIYHAARYADKMAEGIAQGDNDEFEKWMINWASTHQS